MILKITYTPKIWCTPDRVERHKFAYKAEIKDCVWNFSSIFPKKCRGSYFSQIFAIDHFFIILRELNFTNLSKNRENREISLGKFLPLTL